MCYEEGISEDDLYLFEEKSIFVDEDTDSENDKL